MSLFFISHGWIHSGQTMYLEDRKDREAQILKDWIVMTAGNSTGPAEYVYTIRLSATSLTGWFIMRDRVRENVSLVKPSTKKNVPFFFFKSWAVTLEDTRHFSYPSFRMSRNDVWGAPQSYWVRWGPISWLINKSGHKPWFLVAKERFGVDWQYFNFFYEASAKI